MATIQNDLDKTNQMYQLRQYQSEITKLYNKLEIAEDNEKVALQKRIDEYNTMIDSIILNVFEYNGNQIEEHAKQLNESKKQLEPDKNINQKERNNMNNSKNMTIKSIAERVLLQSKKYS